MTIFAPIDEAFDHLSEEVEKNLTSSSDLLEQLIMYHVVPNKKIMISDLEEEDMLVKSVVGDSLRINTYLKSKFYQVWWAICSRNFQTVKLRLDIVEI